MTNTITLARQDDFRALTFDELNRVVGGDMSPAKTGLTFLRFDFNLAIVWAVPRHENLLGSSGPLAFNP